VSQNREQLSEVFLSLQRTGKAAKEAVEQLQRLIGPQVDEAQRSMAKAFESLKVTFELLPGAARIIGKVGWIVQSSFLPGEIISLARLAETEGPDAVDSWFIRFYSDAKKLDRLEKLVLNSPHSTPWANMVQECFWAYRQHRYTLIPPAALAAIEGLITTLLHQLHNPRAVDAFKTWRIYSEKSEPGYVRSIFWESIDAFLSLTWGSKPFDQELPITVNRHVAHHGRRVFETQADALRLLVALACICDNWTYLTAHRDIGKK
jgi:hypothetical protein